MTITEILTNLGLTIRLETNFAQEVAKIFSNSLINHFSKSIVVANGTEFSLWKFIGEKIKIPVYFTDPIVPWQNSSIKHTNKLIREYMSNKSDLKFFSTK